MNPDIDKLQPERDDTDESLGVEREKSDQALAEKRAISEKSADDRVEHAREEGDVARDKDRVKADEVNESAQPGVVATAVARERKRADRILQTERSTADETLRVARQEQAADMAALLPLEREKTDRFLLTERLRSDDALEKRDDFLSIVSHDLRDLLHGILMSSNLLSTKASDTEEGRRTIEGVEQIQRYVARMNLLIGDLVDVVSMDAGRLAIRAEAGDAATLLAEAVNVHALAASDKQLALEVEVIKPPLEADFDYERMLQVMCNLLSNALKFTPPGGTIKVRGQCSENALEVVVSDTGSGIPADEMEDVFERFWQVGENDRRGLGLGLYITRCIVEAHGGSIRLESTPGEGSVFSLSIPRRSRPA